MKDIKTVDEIVRDIEQIVFEISKSNRMDNPNVFNTKVNKVFDICRYYHKAKVEGIDKEKLKDIIIKNADGRHSNCDISAGEIIKYFKQTT